MASVIGTRYEARILFIIERWSNHFISFQQVKPHDLSDPVAFHIIISTVLWQITPMMKQKYVDLSTLVLIYSCCTWILFMLLYTSTPLHFSTFYYTNHLTAGVTLEIKILKQIKLPNIIVRITPPAATIKCYFHVMQIWSTFEIRTVSVNVFLQHDIATFTSVKDLCTSSTTV